MIAQWLISVLIILGFSHVRTQDSGCPKNTSKAILKLAKLTDKDMFLRIAIYKYEFRPFQKWPEKKDLLTPVERLKDLKTKRAAPPSNIQTKVKILDFYKIVIRLDNDRMFVNNETTYFFKDKNQNTKIRRLVHVHSQEEGASLEIKSEEMNLNLEFHMGPKKKKIKKINQFFYNYQEKKNDAFIIDPDLEMGYGEPFTYHVFMYFKNRAHGGDEPNIKADNEVNKALKEIIKSSKNKAADGSFLWERKEKVITNVHSSLCGFLKKWIKSSGWINQTVKIDLYGAAQYIIQHPSMIFTQKIQKGDNLGYGFSGLDFSRDKFMPHVNSTSSAIMRKLFNKYLLELRNNSYQKIDTDGESDDLQFFNKINTKFRKLMQKNFKEWRDAKDIPGDFQQKVYNFDAIVNQVQRTANETDFNDAVYRIFHIDHPQSICRKDCKKISSEN